MKRATNPPPATLAGRKVQILDTIDATGFSDELKETFKCILLPILQRNIPDGKKIELAFLSDPPLIEVRKPL